MRSLSLVIFFLSTGFIVNAQIKDPVKWSFSAKKLSAATYEVHLTASIDPGWHTYSQTTPAGGPVPTSIAFTKNPLLTVNGQAKEVGKLEKKHEEIFGVDVKQYSNKVDFVQVVEVKGNVKTSLAGTVDFMVCNDKECLPPATKKFAVELN